MTRAHRPKSSRSRSRRRKTHEVPAGYRVAEVYFERRGGRSIVGNIYKGRVDNVLAGLEAAFVDIGLDKNGFLHVDEIVLPGVEQAKRGRGNGPRITDLLKPGQEIVVQVVKDPLEDQGRASEHGAHDRRALHGLRAHGRGRRRLAPAGGQGARPAPQGGQAARSGRRRRDHPDGCPRRRASGFRARAAVPVQAQRGPPEARGGHARARPGLPGGGPFGACRARHLLRALRARDRRRRGPAPPPGVVLLAHRAGAGRPRRALRRGRGRPAVRGLRRRPGDQRDARAPRGPAVRRLPDHRLRRGADGHRRQHGLVHGQGQERPARGHDHQDEPRGRRRGRAPAAAARHRRHHRHRLHRHGAVAQPRSRAEGPAQGAGRGPHQDVRGRDLAAGPGRDDAPERHRRRARDHDQAVPGVLGRGRGQVRGDDRDRVRASPAPHGRSRRARTGPRPTCCGSTRGSRRGSSPTARASCTRSSRRPASTSTSRAPTACRWTTSR